MKREIRTKMLKALKKKELVELAADLMEEKELRNKIVYQPFSHLEGIDTPISLNHEVTASSNSTSTAEKLIEMYDK